MRLVSNPFSVVAVLLLAGTVAACSPKFNWRQYHGSAPPFSVLFPDKPQTLRRPIDLNGTHVTMTMTAAEVDGVTFAVGTTEVTDAGMAPAALAAMKTALINNIQGTVIEESAAAENRASAGASTTRITSDVIARGRNPSGQPLLLTGRFVARGKQVYQVIVLGSEPKALRDNTDMFLGSFRLD